MDLIYPSPSSNQECERRFICLQLLIKPVLCCYCVYYAALSMQRIKRQLSMACQWQILQVCDIGMNLGLYIRFYLSHFNHSYSMKSCTAGPGNLAEDEQEN